MEKSIYTIRKEEKLKKYVEKFNHKEHKDNNGGHKVRTSTNQHNPKR